LVLHKRADARAPDTLFSLMKSNREPQFAHRKNSFFASPRQGAAGPVESELRRVSTPRTALTVRPRRKRVLKQAQVVRPVAPGHQVDPGRPDAAQPPPLLDRR